MDSAATSDVQATSILAVLLQSDPSAWWFRPLATSGVPIVSRAFKLQWKLEICDRHLPPSAHAISLAFESHGIDVEQFVTLISNSGKDKQTDFILVRNDSLRLKAEIVAVTSGDLVVGHLIRFREVVESNLIDAVLREINEAQRRLQVLSQREREILHFVYEGRTNKSISISTGISEKTVEKHRSRIMQKLSLNASAELFRLVSKAMILSDLSASADSACLVAAHGASAGFSLQPPMNC